MHRFDAFPQPADKVLTGQPGTDVQIAVMPSVLVSSTNIRSLPLTLRKCFFNDEVCIVHIVFYFNLNRYT